MNLAGIELRYLVNRIARRSKGYYVSNIYGITRGSLLFKLHHPEKSDVFVMLSTSGIWITSKKIDPIEPNRLLRRLRNDLLRAKVTKIEQVGAERIVYMTFNNFEKEFVLAAELFGDGNMILCNSEMKILALLHSIEVRHRRLAVGLQYGPPPSNSLNVFGMDRDGFGRTAGAEVESVRWMGKSLGFPKKYAEEVFHRAGIDPRKPAGSLSPQEMDGLFDTTNRLVLDVVSGNHSPVIVRGDGGAGGVDGKEKPGDAKGESGSGGAPEVYPVEITAPVGGRAEPVPSFMDGLDRVFTEGILDAGRAVRSDETTKKIRQYRSQLEEQAGAIQTVRHRADRIAGVAKAVTGLVSEGILSIEDPRSQELLKRSGAELVTVRGVPHIGVLDERIRIDPRSSLHAIASALFNEAKKQSGAVPTITEQVQRTEKMISRLENRSRGEADSPAGFQEIVKRAWFQRYRWFFTADDMIAIGGRDSSSNSAVIRKHLEKNDRVFHAEVFGSPFFILKDSAAATPAGLSEVAHATVCFSRAWREAMYGMSAYWVMPDQIKKAAPSGQFLPKGSFIVEGQRNFVKIASLKLAVGIVRYNDGHVLTCGPPGPVKRQSVCYAVIEPASGDMAEAGKKVKWEFTKVHEEEAKAIPLDEFVRVLPAGGSHITELGDGQNAGIR